METLTLNKEQTMLDDKKELSDLMDSAIDMREHARKKYAVSLDIDECIRISQMQTVTTHLIKISRSLDDFMRSSRHKASPQ